MIKKTLMCLLLGVGIFGINTSKVLAKNNENITVINPIEVPIGKEKIALEIWDKYADYFSKQPGYIGTKLHKSNDPKAKFRYINIAKWKTGDAFMKALKNPKIKEVGKGFPKDMPHYPSIYEVIRD